MQFPNIRLQTEDPPMRRLVAVVSLLLVAFFAPLVKAQNVASMTGIVTDTTGAVIEGVQVELSNPTTGVAYKAVTNSVGSYTIPAAQPGPGYTAKFSREGFKSVVVTGLYLNVNAARSQNAQLSVGAVVESVSVSATNETVTLDTVDASVGNNFQVQFLNELPIQIRDSPATLFTQQP